MERGFSDVAFVPPKLRRRISGQKSPSFSVPFFKGRNKISLVAHMALP
jgi:hypothetical protein